MDKKEFARMHNDYLDPDKHLDMPELQEWIFTFGTAHTHPETGEGLGRAYVAIEAEDYEGARVLMVQKFGQKWAFQYHSREQAGVQRWNLHEVPLPEEDYVNPRAE